MGKCESKKLTIDAGKVFKTLVSLRKTFVEKLTKKEYNTVEETKFGEDGNAVQILGSWTPEWVQRLAKDAVSRIWAILAYLLLLFLEEIKRD